MNLGGDFEDATPYVVCMTDIYHPNIDTSDQTNNDSSNICLNVFDIPGRTFGLDGVVLGLIFLLKNPNLDDPLSPYFEGYDDIDVFKENVERYMRGEDVDGTEFKTKFRVIDGITTEVEISEQNQESDTVSKDENCDASSEGLDSAKETVTACNTVDKNVDGDQANEQEVDLQEKGLLCGENANSDQQEETKVPAKSSDTELESSDNNTPLPNDDKTNANVMVEEKDVEEVKDDLINCNADEETDFCQLVMVNVGEEFFIACKGVDQDIVDCNDPVKAWLDNEALIINTPDTGKDAAPSNDDLAYNCDRIEVTLDTSEEVKQDETPVEKQASVMQVAQHDRFTRLKSAFFKLLYMLNCTVKAYERVKM